MENYDDIVDSAVSNSKLINSEDHIAVQLLKDQLKMYLREKNIVDTDGGTVTTVDKNGYTVHKQNPSFANMQQSHNQVITLLKELALTPKERSKILRDVSEADDKLKQFMNIMNDTGE